VYGYKDMSGLTFGQLFVLNQKPTRNEHGELAWICRCSCGTELSVRGYCLRRGQTKSCGCLRGENGKRDWTTHGLSKTPEYNSWISMVRRCTDPNNEKYPDYGARGITVCRRWLESVENFIQDMGKMPGRGYTIDRINNDEGYEPGNCRWATAEMQANNQRRTVLHEFEGENLTLAQIARRIPAIPYPTLVDRVSVQGMTLRDALARDPRYRQPDNGSL